MWIVTTRGFFSVVAHRDEPATVLVRARVRSDLESLGNLLGPLDIRHTPDADYAYRVVMPRERWSHCLAVLAEEIDYPNFKDAVAKRQGWNGARIYHHVWSALGSLQWGAE